VVVPTANGEVLAGLHAAIVAAVALDVLEAAPRLVAAQPAGCAPIVDAIRSGADAAAPIETPDTIAGALEVPDPAFDRHAIAAVRDTGGDAVAVEDDAILAAACRVAAAEGIEASVAGGAAAAGARALDDAGAFEADETVAVLNTGAGSLDADVLRSHLMHAG